MAGKSVDKKFEIDSKVLDSLVKIEEELKGNKYAFIAFSSGEDYQMKVERALDFFPEIRLASVSPLSHLPKAERDYQLYTFRSNKTRHGTGTGGLA